MLRDVSAEAEDSRLVMCGLLLLLLLLNVLLAAAAAATAAAADDDDDDDSWRLSTGDIIDERGCRKFYRKK